VAVSIPPTPFSGEIVADHRQQDRLGSAIAGAIGIVAPGLALKYFQRRQILANYTGASKSGPNREWRPKNQSADAILSKDRQYLLGRARDLERNNGNISGAINKICNNVVFTGISPQAQLRTSDRKLRKVENDRLEAAFQEWAEEVGFYDDQALVLRHLWIDGEPLIHRTADRDLLAKGLCPLRLEVLECDFLDSSLNGELENGNIVKAGIEFDKRGLPVAYHIFTEHPGDGLYTRSAYGKTRRIPATEICHPFLRRRATQTRGVSWLASIIMEMRDFTEYQSSERIAARLAAAFGVFIESPYPEHQLSGFNPLDTTSTVNEWLEQRQGGSFIDPGRIDVLPPGTKISVAENKRPGANYPSYNKTSLKNASAGSGLSYENFSNDYSESTYSSARQAVLEERRGYRVMQYFLNRRFNRWVWNTWCDYASVSNILGNIPAKVPVQWQNPGWSWIDPAKDAKGAQIELDMKITNRRRLAAERGIDWDENVEELAEEKDILRENNLDDPPPAPAGDPIPMEEDDGEND
jgi:lambda family phage portal protein